MLGGDCGSAVLSGRYSQWTLTLPIPGPPHVGMLGSHDHSNVSVLYRLRRAELHDFLPMANWLTGHSQYLAAADLR